MCYQPTKIPFIGDLVRVACAISNKYFQPLKSSNECDEDLAQYMTERLHMANHLQEYVEINNLERRSVSKWSTVEDCNISDFPRLDEAMMRQMTLGTYQMKLSSSYLQEYISSNCCFQLYNEAPNLLRVRLQSRHISSKSYLVWVQYSSDQIDAWYCKCRAGACTLGTCLHVAAVLWYLGCAIREKDVTYGVRDWGQYIEDASELPQSIDLSDSDESVMEE